MSVLTRYFAVLPEVMALNALRKSRSDPLRGPRPLRDHNRICLPAKINTTNYGYRPRRVLQPPAEEHEQVGPFIGVPL